VRSDGKPSRGILEAVDFWLLSDLEISQWPTTFEKDLTIYHYHYQHAPVTPLQGYLPNSPHRVLGTCDQSYRRRVAIHGSIPPVFCNLALVSLDSEARTMTSLGSKTSEWLSLCHLPLSCRLRGFCTRTRSLSPDPSRRL
jgi:hypothetical protein